MIKKITILMLIIVSININAQPRTPKFVMCNVVFTSITISGPMSIENGNMDLNDACVTFTISFDLCNPDGSVMAGGFNGSVQSSGCSAHNQAKTQITMEELELLSNLSFDNDSSSSIDLPIVYPNPSKDIFTLMGTENLNSSEIKIFNNNGDLVNGYIKTSGKEFQIDLSLQPKGNYFIVFEKDGTSFKQQLIKN